MDFQPNAHRAMRIIFSLIVASLLLLTVSRGLFLLLAADFSDLTGLGNDLFRAFWVGARFDAKIIAIAFAPLFLAGLVLAAFSKGFSLWQRAVPNYAFVIFFLLSAFSIGNYYYYVTYGNYIDVFAFGLFDDDTEAVLENAWEDYPILRSFFVSLAVAWLSRVGAQWLVERLQKCRFTSRHWSYTTAVIVVTILLYVVIARGSIGTLPLKRYHANVSDNKLLNIITPNAFMALDWAKSDYKKQSKFEPISAQAVEAQMMKVLGQPTPYFVTPENAYLAENPPHVVMALMEGMGTNVLIEDDAQSNDLLGTLREGFEQDFVFKRFMAGTSATIDSIVMMLMHSDVPTISHSSAQKKPLASSAVLPYKQAGYRVVFIYGGNGMWRNLSNYLPVQGFDQVYDENSIKNAFPDAAKHADTWGVPDEFTFKFARKVLDDATQPTLIYIMTVTNHSPFRAPSDYQAKPVKASERLKTLLGPMEKEADDLLQAYQYANDSLGQFVQGVKQSPLAEKTVIAASGDHRVRYLAIDKEAEFGLTFGVPFYLYVPESILQNVEHQYDPSRIGSHRDIFPTLYHLSLSAQQYVSLGGENMLSTHGVSNIGFNASRVITELGAYSTSKPERLYPWGEGLYSQETTIANPQPEWAADYRKLMNDYLRLQVTQP
ncbi:phosphoglycerol transferase [Vibrio vulnificus]|uniref:LTA synthase family protein n=1 Tax=Vibrio vulnificus TaxID=672 RepID=UPI000501517C|nr:alkaline phosphatase family protein [Vibrio vulnificus]EGR8991359.1 sulfatase-like hydrolase/transferase [Vibrio vulnificus]EHV5552204.1 sulfatase-like hydrolase/transferase [Vibrio vulnificus]KFK49778.1 phosphoglycerol transferase [Vibrio vulnificus]MCA0785027.1 sulfatase-like hydrolase/transferase [Vibrio vulnificus]MCU8565121.1 sulfatase-like hydrolase/transferase [Vibrio vulnificus]